MVNKSYLSIEKYFIFFCDWLLSLNVSVQCLSLLHHDISCVFAVMSSLGSMASFAAWSKFCMTYVGRTLRPTCMPSECFHYILHDFIRIWSVISTIYFVVVCIIARKYIINSAEKGSVAGVLRCVYAILQSRQTSTFLTWPRSLARDTLRSDLVDHWQAMSSNVQAFTLRLRTS